MKESYASPVLEESPFYSKWPSRGFEAYRLPLSKMSPDVYQFINMMCRFIISVSYPLNDPRGEGKETCSETHDEMINMQKIMFVQGLDQLANCMFREGKEMVLERPLLILIE